MSNKYAVDPGGKLSVKSFFGDEISTSEYVLIALENEVPARSISEKLIVYNELADRPTSWSAK